MVDYLPDGRVANPEWDHVDTEGVVLLTGLPPNILWPHGGGALSCTIDDALRDVGSHAAAGPCRSACSE